MLPLRGTNFMFTLYEVAAYLKTNHARLRKIGERHGLRFTYLMKGSRLVIGPLTHEEARALIYAFRASKDASRPVTGWAKK
jgi:hypothetical protein